MCGIVGYVGAGPVQELLLAALERLEYRGYDSAGISVLSADRLDSVRAVGNLLALRAAITQRAANGDGRTAVAVAEAASGIGHTRWATHGRVSERNAHPHMDGAGRIHVVVNGIVENYLALKRELAEEHVAFSSETDAEVIAHVIARRYDGDLPAAVQAAYGELEGHFAFVAMAAEQPGVLVGARRECPLVVGRGDGEQFLASAVPAFLEHTRRVQFIEDGELVVVRPSGAELMSAATGEPVEREIVEIDWDAETAEKGGFETFMLKEIHEQAAAVAETIADRTTRGEGVDLGDLGSIDDAFLSAAHRIVVVACGTSYHAGLIGRYAIEGWARVPVEMDIASEYRYRDPVVGPGDLVVGISQSGETADTLAAMRLAAQHRAKVLAITNVMGSQATRDANGVMFTRAGLEIGVAATKTFVAQVAAMYLLALRLAELRGTLEPTRLTELVTELKRLPDKVAGLLALGDATIQAIAERHRDAPFFLYLGRHIGLPVALEGALKLKEIAYVATDAYAAGEMKHGPIALLGDETPVVCVATDSPVLDKLISNIQEVRARGAHVIVVATAGNEQIGAHADEILTVPETDSMLAPLLAVIPLQLLAYHVGRLRGLNVDQPRNLAKTVTVE
jgi:glucosamine--fructose-6-phosphate aminotransferase (isomerizing)